MNLGNQVNANWPDLTTKKNLRFVQLFEEVTSNLRTIYKSKINNNSKVLRKKYLRKV